MLSPVVGVLIMIAMLLSGCTTMFCRVGKGHHTEIEGPVRESWVNLYGGDDSDIATQLVVDGSGSVYVSGNLGTIEYDGEGKRLQVAGRETTAMTIDAENNLYTTGCIECGACVGCGDYVTKKYDGKGKLIWSARYNGPYGFWDTPRAIAVDGLGNVYVTGCTCDDKVSICYNRNYSTVKYDSKGNQLWVARYESPTKGSGHPDGIAVDSTGNVYVSGSSYDKHGFEEYTVIKYDGNGNQLWVAPFSSPGAFTTSLNAMVLDGSGNIYIVGSSDYKGEGVGYLTVKYDSDGNQIWAARYNGPVSGADEANAIAVDVSGNVYVTGYSSGNYTVGRSYVNNTVTDIYGGSDYATVKYDRDGNQLWVARYNGLAAPYGDRPRAIAIDYSGNVYVTGYSDGNGTQNDIATLKYDTNGNQVWVARYNGELNLDDEAYAIVLDAQGNVYVAGSTTTKACGAILDERYYEDYVVMKYTQ